MVSLVIDASTSEPIILLRMMLREVVWPSNVVLSLRDRRSRIVGAWWAGLRMQSVNPRASARA